MSKTDEEEEEALEIRQRRRAIKKGKVRDKRSESRRPEENGMKREEDEDSDWIARKSFPLI